MRELGESGKAAQGLAGTSGLAGGETVIHSRDSKDFKFARQMGKKRKEIKKEKDWRFYARKLTVIFNRYIRLRDTTADAIGRWGYCFTCRKYWAFESLQAGHFIGCQYLGTKWEEKNVNAQCVPCNYSLEGNKVVYAEKLKEKYGPDILDLLAIQKKLFAKAPDILVIQGRIKIYQEKIKEIQ